MTAPLHYYVFESAFGTCAIAWSDKGIASVQLPDATIESMVKKLTICLRPRQVQESTSPPAWVLESVEKISQYLDGKQNHLSSIKIDLEGVAAFHTKVYEALRKVPEGQLVSYKELAYAAGSRLASRAVGQAMAKNRLPLIVPCHRVIKASGELGNFTSYGGVGMKKRLLDLESTAAKKDKKDLTRV